MGGIIAVILDDTAGRVLLEGFPPRFMDTTRPEIRYRKTVPIGEPLKLIDRAGKIRGRMAESWAGMYGPDETLLAKANALYMDLPNSPDASSLGSFGWKVCPDEQVQDTF